MEVMDAIRGRRSIRVFSGKLLDATQLSLFKEAIVMAPSAGNLQSRKFYFVFNPDLKQKLAEAAFGQYFISEAPLAVVACCDAKIKSFYGRRGVELYSIQDVAASIQNLLLEAYSLGLGAVWVGAFNEERVASAMGLPENLRPVAIVPVGHPAESPQAPPRVHIEDAIEDVL